MLPFDLSVCKSSLKLVIILPLYCHFILSTFIISRWRQPLLIQLQGSSTF